ncbi:Na+-dependent transporter of the SNF family [Congregibacter litoralis KT71]|uniref:Na+-dependent transporter of the SNF family n=2 Tax=Congregibacter TaxID=393661 RepID=A4A8C0_9GAMM|nr:Na+-dependent transporter of the SNF family [Congregibacter litoralis KT71]
MAAAGSAVGLGNIWGFPTQAASNGGAAFLIVYLILAFVLAYPALMAELVLGRHAHANAVTALKGTSSNPLLRNLGATAGIVGFIVASLILSFYAIVAGWMIAHCLASLAALVGATDLAEWLVGFSLTRNVIFMTLFMGMTIAIISAGVRDGIERWSSRLMPLLLLTLFALVVYVLTLDGASEGLRVYLMPDFESALSPQLIIKALGSAFFSLSLGVGTMLIYGSYISDKENLPVAGGLVTAVDIGIAVLAGFLVLPAMYVALNNGVEIFAADGALLSEDTLIFTVLPELFSNMGLAGGMVSLTFFFLMSIAALTSSISMLEVPVAYTIENHGVKRLRAVMVIGALIAMVSLIILLNFGTLFGAIIALTTRYSQPLLGFVFCIYVGWIWHRDAVLTELKKGAPDIAEGLFWKIWPWHLRLVCPAIILLIFVQSLR